MNIFLHEQLTDAAQRPESQREPTRRFQLFPTQFAQGAGWEQKAADPSSLDSLEQSKKEVGWPASTSFSSLLSS